MKTLEKTKNYYNAIAKGYKELYHLEQIQKINLVKNYIPKEGKILDLGSGDGVLNQYIENKDELISIDSSKELLNLNSNKKENKIVGDICNLNFKENSFDYICSFTVIQDVYDIKKALLEIKRIIKENGQIILSFLKKSNNKEIIINLIEKEFKIIKIIEEEKDFIYILKKN